MNDPAVRKGVGPRLRGERGGKVRPSPIPLPQGEGLCPPSHPAVFPAKAGTQTLSHRRDGVSRMNAFAGNADEGYKAAAICAANPFNSAISAILPWP